MDTGVRVSNVDWRGSAAVTGHPLPPLVLVHGIGETATCPRRSALLACVTSKLSYGPDALLPLVSVPALVAPAGAIATDDEAGRDRELELCDAVGLFWGRARLVRYPAAGHNLARHMPQEPALELAAMVLLGAG
jgi:hypothetical protein